MSGTLLAQRWISTLYFPRLFLLLLLSSSLLLQQDLKTGRGVWTQRSRPHLQTSRAPYEGVRSGARGSGANRPARRRCNLPPRPKRAGRGERGGAVRGGAAASP